MKRYLSLIIAILAIQTDLFSAEVGMPQLDSTYWFSQSFWLILIFLVLYLSLSKFLMIRLSPAPFLSITKKFISSVEIKGKCHISAL